MMMDSGGHKRAALNQCHREIRMNIKMYNINLLIRLLKSNNIRRIVISPGGTNIPFVKGVQDDEEFICYSVVDERSAAYFAIGLYLQTGEPVALCCTSAQATRNYVPGLTEAYYKRVPLLAITMMKHPRFTYQEYMQAPDQASLPKDSVKRTFIMPFVSDVNDAYHSMRVANEAIQELTHECLGPVQICIPWLDFPISDAEPKFRVMHTHGLGEKWDIDLRGRRVLLVIGEHRPFGKNEKEAIEAFCDRCGAVIYTNLLSNYASERSVSANLLLTVMSKKEFKEFAPDVLITIGGQTGDYPLYRMLSQPEFSAMEHWRVSSDGSVADTYDKLTDIFQCDETSFFKRVVEELGTYAADNSYLLAWRRAEAGMVTNVKIPFSGVFIARSLIERLPAGSVVQLSILNSLRVWNLFRPRVTGAQFYSNVGAFGIDGGMSTLIGQSFATDELCFMIIGDLAFLYDINSLSIRGLRANVRILLVNNGGGFEFKLGVGHDESTDRYIAAAGHLRSAEGWARDCGFRYIRASTADEFESALEVLVEESDKPIILEAIVSDDDENEAYQAVVDANRSLTVTESVKRGIKGALGSERVNRLKSALNR